VQTVALRIICERERTIQAFEPQEYWSITAHLEAEFLRPSRPSLSKRGRRRSTSRMSRRLRESWPSSAGRPSSWTRSKRRPSGRIRPPPFTTSKLQQEAIRRLRFTAKKTMMIAQQLYEGIDLGPGEPVGLITYMRTDSTRIADVAAAEGAAADSCSSSAATFALERPRHFRNSKQSQDAHEAIRPTRPSTCRTRSHPISPGTNWRSIS